MALNLHGDDLRMDVFIRSRDERSVSVTCPDDASESGCQMVTAPMYRSYPGLFKLNAFQVRQMQGSSCARRIGQNWAPGMYIMKVENKKTFGQRLL